MSSHAATKIDQKEYLKKYLSGDKVKKKKKDKTRKKNFSSSYKNVRIIDDNAFDNNAVPEIDEELLLTGDDAPQIVGEYVEENPNRVPENKWRNITIKEEKIDNEVQIKQEPIDDYEYNTYGCNGENSKWEPTKSLCFNIKDEFSDKRIQNIILSRKQDSKSSLSLHKDKVEQVRKNRSPSRTKSKFQSPSRRKHREHSSDYSPSRRKPFENFSDHSPTRRKQRHNSIDQSPPRRKQREYSSDQSPVRRKQRHNSRDQSPSRRKHREHSSDYSPSRRKPLENFSDHSPTRRKQRHNSIDQSPPRRTQREHSSDQSPPRRIQREYSTDQSPFRRKQRHNSRDQSPSRRKPREHSSNESPSRRKNTNQFAMSRDQKLHASDYPSHRSKSRWDTIITNLNRPPSSPSPPPTHKPKVNKTLDGKTAGLQNAAALKIETEKHRCNEEQMYEKMSRELSSRDSEVQVRSTGRRGKRARDAKEEDPETQRRREAHEKKKKEHYDRWGLGLKQVEDYRARLVEDEYEANKPLARYADDEDLDRHLREQERAEDPMLEYMRRKKKEKQKDKNEPVIPVYEGSYPENRFGIRPGYRWDGVDRSNGYEKKWLSKQNEKLALQDEAYKYSVEDM